MNDFKIDEGIRLPKQRENDLQYPFLKMKPGDSFFVPNDGTPRFFNKVQSAASRRKVYGQHFATRKVDGGIRVWRVK